MAAFAVGFVVIWFWAATPAYRPWIVEILGMSFIAIAVWLSIPRIAQQPKRLKRTVAGLAGAFALYVVLFGPGCWWFATQIDACGNRVQRAPTVFWPVGWAANRMGPGARRLLCWYGTLATKEKVVVPACAGYRDGYCDQPEFWMEVDDLAEAKISGLSPLPE